MMEMMMAMNGMGGGGGAGFGGNLPPLGSAPVGKNLVGFLYLPNFIFI